MTDEELIKQARTAMFMDERHRELANRLEKANHLVKQRGAAVVLAKDWISDRDDKIKTLEGQNAELKYFSQSKLEYKDREITRYREALDHQDKWLWHIQEGRHVSSMKDLISNLRNEIAKALAGQEDGE